MNDLDPILEQLGLHFKVRMARGRSQISVDRFHWAVARLTRSAGGRIERAGHTQATTTTRASRRWVGPDRRGGGIAQPRAHKIDRVSEQSATKVITALAACEYSHRVRSSVQFAGTAVQLLVATLAG
jgi:hypothetical protein